MRTLMRPPPGAHDRVLLEGLEQLEQLSGELEELASSADDDAAMARVGMALARTEHAAVAVEDALSQVAFDAFLSHLSRLNELAEPCVCGRDRGDHLVDPPHPSDDDDDDGCAPCAGFRAGDTIRCGPPSLALLVGGAAR